VLHACTPQELIGSYTTIYISCLPHWTLLILRQYNGLNVSTEINLANAALHFYMMLETFVFSRRLWGLPSTSSPASGYSSDAASMRSTYRQASSKYIDIDCGGPAKAAMQQWKSSMEILCNPTMHAAYSGYVERCLCYGECMSLCLACGILHSVNK
jgi:hypothetical protein